MPVYRLIITVELDEDSDEVAIAEAKAELTDIYNHGGIPVGQTTVKLQRDGDRAGLNLLLPKLQGRTGEHFQGRKASMKEVVD